MAAENVLLNPAEMSPSLQGIPTAHSEVWKRARRLLGKLSRSLRSPAGSARTILPCSQGSLQVPRCCSRPAPYLQCTHPEGEDVHSSPISLFCKTKPEPYQARGTGHHPLTLGTVPCTLPHPYRCLCPHTPCPHPCPCLTSLCPRLCSCLLPPPWHTFSHSSLHKPFPFIPLKFAPKYSKWGSHNEFSHGAKILYSFFPNRHNILHAFECS